MNTFNHELNVTSNASVTLAVDQPIILARLLANGMIIDELFHPPSADGITYLNFFDGMSLHQNLFIYGGFRIQILTESPNVPQLIETEHTNYISPDDAKTTEGEFKLTESIPRKRKANNFISYTNGLVSIYDWN